MKPARLNTNLLQEPFQQSEFSSGVIITFQVMAVARVSPRHPDTISPVTEGCKNELGAYPGRARNPDNPEIGRVLETAHTGQIRRSVTAPVTKKCCNLWLPIAHNHLLNRTTRISCICGFDKYIRDLFRSAIAGQNMVGRVP